jgi:hypothetical protein
MINNIFNKKSRNININDDDYRRYKYIPIKRKPRLKSYLILLTIIAAIITLLAIFWWWPSWFADISLREQLYSNKASTASYFEVLFLNFWSTNFFFNKTALIGAIIGVVIMNIPPDRTLLTTIGTKLGFGKPSYLKAFLFWTVFGFVLFYLIGFTLNLNGGAFAWTAYLVNNGELPISPNIILDAFNVILNINSKDLITIFIYRNLILPVVNLILGILIFRAILNIIKNVYLRRDDYYVAANVLIIIGLAFGMGLFSIPTIALDGINLIQIWSVIFGFIAFIGLGCLIYIYGRIKYARSSKNYILERGNRKTFTIGLFLILILILIPLFISLGPVIGLNNTAVWTEQEWSKKINREIQWTRETAGLDMFEERPIYNFSQSTVTPDAQMISQVRQFDQDFAVQYLAASIGSTYEGLADSDIVYINGTEYWVAPKTIRFSQIAADPVQISTELLDHVEGFFAIGTFSGTLVDTLSVFNISNHYPIFFGESESAKYLQNTLGYIPESIQGAYDSDILLGTEWVGGIPNNIHNYTAQPDGTLTGLEGFWKTLNLGLFAYAFQNEHNYLVNRNIKTRVSSILLPQLKIDNDPYLVFDMAHGKLYYAVSIYTSVEIGTYAQYPVLRFLGLCLVDVGTGELTFVKSPSLDTSTDPTYPLWKIYLSKYDWQSGPEWDWLIAQLRYPEDLFESQLAANYIYHVQNPTTWKSETDFQERPPGTDLYYIETDLGEGVEYVGLNLVEYRGRAATLLAGMYVVRQGDHFGEAIFYYTRGLGVTLIGPVSANQTYTSEATQQITLISGARNGNILMYPLAGSIYYFIPTYSTSGALQQLKLAGFVEAFTRKVGYGSEAPEAYEALNITGIEPPPGVPISFDFTMDSSMSYPDTPANFRITLQNLNLNYTAPGLNVKVNLSIYTSTTNDVNYSLILPPSYYPIANFSYVEGAYTWVNYTIVDKTLDFGEGFVLNGFLNTTKGNIVVYYQWTLIVDDIIIYTSITRLLSVLQ